MPPEDFHGIVASGTADVSTAQFSAGSNSVWETYDPLVDIEEIIPQFRDMVVRIMDDQIFVVDPDSPPPPPTRQ